MRRFLSTLTPWAETRALHLLPRNVIIWEGPSELTGDPIFVIASGKTRNRKIGAMVQLWILPEMDVIEAVQTGADRAICGDCVHRGDGKGRQRACYVDWWRSPENIHQYRHRADHLSPQAFAAKHAGKQFRIGAYGDPAAVPLGVWEPLIETAGGWTAYTHQWRTVSAGFRAWCMASVDTEAEQREAETLGWRTFRTRFWTGAILPNEVTCPASEEGGHKAVCATCSLCRGAARPAKHVVIVAHGSGAKWFGSTRPDAPTLFDPHG